MSNKETGGPAFAAGAVRKVRSRPGDSGSDWVASEFIEPAHFGMTMRDYFAAKALPSMISIYEPIGNEGCINDCAEAEYQYADAMLEARK